MNWFQSCAISDKWLVKRLGLISKARIVWSILYILIAFSIQSKIPTASFVAIIMVALIGILQSVFYCSLVSKYPRFIKSWAYFSSIVDITALALGIYYFGTFRTFKTEAYLMFFVMLEMSTWGRDIDTVKYAIATWFVSYAMITFHAIVWHTIELGSITDSFTTHAVSFENILVQFVLTLAYSFFIYHRVRGYADERI